MLICSYGLFFSVTNALRLREEISAALLSNKFWQTPLKILFLINKNKTMSVTGHCPKFTKHKSSLTFGLSQYSMSGSTFPSSKQLASLQQSRKQSVLVLASPTCPRCAGALHQETLQSKPSIVFWNSFWEWLTSIWQMTSRGSNFDSNSWTWTLQPDQRVTVTSCKGLSAPKQLNNLCGVWILFSLVENN